MLRWVVHLTVQGVALVVGLLLTRHPDFRENRRSKLIWSAVFFAMLTEGAILGSVNDPFVFMLCTLGALGLITANWAGVIAQWGAHHQVNFFYRDIHSITGLRADFRFAINHRRDGEMGEALKSVQEELLKEPKNFEGLLLLAQIYQDQNKPEEAVAPLQNILNSSTLSESQRALARNEMANCKRLIDLQAIQELNKRPNT